MYSLLLIALAPTDPVNSFIYFSGALTVFLVTLAGIYSGRTWWVEASGYRETEY